MKDFQDWLQDKRYYRRDRELIPFGDYCYHMVTLRPGEAPRSVDLDGFGITYPYYPADGSLLCPYLRLSNHQVVYCDLMGLASLNLYGDVAANRAKALAHYGSACKLEQALSRHSGYLYDLLKECGVKEEDHTVLPIFDVENYDYSHAAERHPLYHEQAVPYLMLPRTERVQMGLDPLDDFFRRFYGLGSEDGPRRLYAGIDEYASDYLASNF